MRDRNRAGWDRAGLLADLETMSAAPAPPAAAGCSAACAPSLLHRALASGAAAGAGRGGGRWACSRCAPPQSFFTSTHHWSTPWLFALSSNASEVLLRVFSLVIDWGYLITQFVVGCALGPLSLLQVLETTLAGWLGGPASGALETGWLGPRGGFLSLGGLL